VSDGGLEKVLLFCEVPKKWSIQMAPKHASEDWGSAPKMLFRSQKPHTVREDEIAGMRLVWRCRWRLTVGWDRRFRYGRRGSCQCARVWRNYEADTKKVSMWMDML